MRGSHAHAEDIGRLKVHSAIGQMIPLSTLLKVDTTTGPERTNRYNSLLAADINASPAPGFSSGQAQAAIQKSFLKLYPRTSITSGRT